MLLSTGIGSMEATNSRCSRKSAGVLESSLLLRACVAAVFDVAYAVSAGILLNRLLLASSNPCACERQLRICLIVSVSVMLVTGLVQLLLLSAAMTGDLSWKLAWSSLPDVLTTHAGHTLLMSCSFIPLLLLLSIFPWTMKHRAGTWLGIALFLGVTVYRSALGHAASDGDFTIREMMQFLHLCSIAVWGGGVAVSGLALVPQSIATAQPEEILAFVRRLSRTVTVALIVVVLSGIYNAWRGLGGSLVLLPQTAWGRMLTVKVGIVFITFFQGARVRFLLQSKRSPNTDRALLVYQIGRWLRVEAILMICVLIVSGWLANLPLADM